MILEGFGSLPSVPPNEFNRIFPVFLFLEPTTARLFEKNYDEIKQVNSFSIMPDIELDKL